VSNRERLWEVAPQRKRRSGTQKRAFRVISQEHGPETRVGETREERGKQMDLRDIKYHSCPVDDEDGILLVDMETESMPEMDEDGNYLYYCNSGHTFKVDEEESDYYSGWRR
jgi:hypothetical protein